MVQDDAFLLEKLRPVVIADPPDLSGFLVIRVCELIGEADGVLAGPVDNLSRQAVSQAIRSVSAMRMPPRPCPKR